MSKKKIVVPGVFFALIIVLALIFRPLAPAPVENTARTNGTIAQVMKTGGNDVILQLEGDDRVYYLDEAAAGRSQASLEHDLEGQAVEIYYVKRWMPLGKLKQIARLDVNKTVVYSNMRR